MVQNTKNSKPRKGRPKKNMTKTGGQGIKMLLAGLFLTGFLVLCLVVLGQLRQTLHSGPKPLPLKPSQITANVRLELETMLWRAGISFEALHVFTEPDRVRYVVAASAPNENHFTELEKRLNTLPGDLRLIVIQPYTVVEIVSESGLLHRLEFTPAQKVKPGPARPQVAIVVDDLGFDLASARTLVEMDLAVTFSILPYAPKAVAVARLARQHGVEAILHIPMEPHGYPAIDPGPEALLQSTDPEAVKRQVRSWLDGLPYVVGGNNHMGSRLTEQNASMAAVMETLRERQLFFVDSRTSEASVAVAEARRAGIPVASRDVFLDNVRDVEAISRQIHQLVAVARRKGSAIGIGHPYPETLEALRRESRLLREQGIDVVPVSRLVYGGGSGEIGKGG